MPDPYKHLTTLPEAHLNSRIPRPAWRYYRALLAIGLPARRLSIWFWFDRCGYNV